MTQILSFGPTPRLGQSEPSGLAMVDWLFSKIRQPDVMVVLAVCAIGLILTLTAAATIPGFSSALAETYSVVGP